MKMYDLDLPGNIKSQILESVKPVARYEISLVIGSITEKGSDYTTVTNAVNTAIKAAVVQVLPKDFLESTIRTVIDLAVSQVDGEITETDVEVDEDRIKNLAYFCATNAAIDEAKTAFDEEVKKETVGTPRYQVFFNTSVYLEISRFRIASDIVVDQVYPYLLSN